MAWMNEFPDAKLVISAQRISVLGSAGVCHTIGLLCAYEKPTHNPKPNNTIAMTMKLFPITIGWAEAWLALVFRLTI